MLVRAAEVLQELVRAWCSGRALLLAGMGMSGGHLRGLRTTADAKMSWHLLQAGRLLGPRMRAPFALPATLRRGDQG